MSKPKTSAAATAKPSLRRLHFIMCTCFTCVGLASFQGLAWSRHTNHWRLVGLFALICYLCLIAATLSIFFPLAYGQLNKPSRRSLQTERLRRILRTESHDFIAKFSTGSKVTVLFLWAGLALVAGFLFYHSARWPLFLMVGALLIANSIVAYRVCFTTVRFSSHEISVQIAPFVRFSETYSDITDIRTKEGYLKLTFADRRSVTLWSGLGDSGEICSILMRNTDVLPNERR
jgi:hypothetical protein